MCVCVMKITVTLNSDPKLEAQRQRLPSVGAADLLPSLEGVELGSSGKVNVKPSATENQKCPTH